jgi:selenocysteine-specific elongation factor
MVRLAAHRVALESRFDDVARLLAAVTGEHESLPPTLPQLVRSGIPRDVVEAAAREGTVVRIAPDLVVAPSLVDRAVVLVRANAATGVTVSAVREALGTSRKFAVPLVEWMDRQGYTRREGDLRFPRDA